MLAFFRRALSSWVAVAILGLVMIAFVVTGVGSPGGGLTGGPAANVVATVGGAPIPDRTVAAQAEAMLADARQQQPDLTMADFLGAVGGVEPIVQRLIGGQILARWAERNGMAASDRLIGSEIAKVPAFRGPTGQFDENVMNAVLGRQRIPFKELRDGVRDDLLRQQLVAPISTGGRAPAGMLDPYARLLLNRREGAIGLVAASADGIPAPTDADIANWYKANIARYTVPERRVIRYAALAVEPAAPTEAEIAAAYRADAAKYAAGETRTVSQVVLPDEAAARAFATQVQGGTPFAQAAAARGLSASDIALGTLGREALAQASSPQVAAAAFGVESGGTTAPIKVALGWAIAHVGEVRRVQARSLDQARGEIAGTLSARKRDEALAALVSRVEDSLNDGATFDEIVQAQKLTAIVTPALLPDGRAPDDAAFQPDETVQPLLRIAGQMSPDDDPTVEPLDGGSRQVLLSVASVVPATPVPLAQVREQVAQDVIGRRATDRARATAQAVLAKVNGGQSMAAAFAAAKLPPPQPVALTQIEVARTNQQVPAPVRALFRLAAGKSELVALPGGSWTIVHLDRIAPGDTAQLPALIASSRVELGESLGREFAEQFVNAARADLKVVRNAEAQARLEQQLRGNTPAR